MRVLVEESRKLRRASACIRDAGVIHVKLPRHWSRALKQEVTNELVERLRKKDAREKSLLDKKVAQQRLITITTNAELEAHVRQINAETFQVPLGKIQIGNAKHTRLAQINLSSKTMTVSRYCLNQAPAEALRYLIVHELAHNFEAGHGPRFWALVETHVPDYRLQSRIMKAFHHQAVIQDSEPDALEIQVASLLKDHPFNKPSKPAPTVTLPDMDSPPPRKRDPVSQPPKPRIKAQRSKSPKSPEITPEKRPLAEPLPERGKTGSLLPGFVKQLLLWVDR
jgi:hypothetical protein